MTRHIALLRGINVGKAKRIAMADLRALLADLGFASVRTLLNSGNVVFDAPARAAGPLAVAIRRAVHERLGVDCEVVVKPASAVAAAIAEHPLRDHHDDDARLLVMFLQDPKDLAALAPLADRGWGREAFAVGHAAAWLWCADGIIASPLARAVDKAGGQRGTARNWATLVKLDALARAD